MRQRCLLALMALFLVAGVTPAIAQEQKNNIQIVDQSEDPPVDLLSEEEIERIDRLQNEAVTTLPFSPVSPDDSTVLALSGDDIVFVNIADGSGVVLDPNSFGPFAPLPLLGFSSFVWLDERTLGSLALDFNARREEEAFVKLFIDRETLEVSAERVRFPSDVLLLSVAPNLDTYLLALLPPEPEEDTGEAVGSPLRVPVTRDAPSAGRIAKPNFSPAMQQRMERARAHPAFARLWMMQEDVVEEELAATPTTLDLVLFTNGGETRYLTTIPIASVSFGDTWTRDSSRLAFSFFGLADPDRNRPFFDGALLSEEVYRDVTGNLPPALNPILQNNNTYIVDVGSGATEILRPSGAAPPILSAVGWSTDNSTLLVQAWHPARIRGRTHPIYTPQFAERTSYRFYQGTREVGRLESELFAGAAFSGAVAEFVSPDELIFRAPSGTNRYPYYYNRISGELRNLGDRPGSYWNVAATNQSRQIVFMHTSFTEPPELYRIGWDGRGLVRLTWLNEELRQFAALRQDPVSFTLRNGQMRRGVLIQPADAAFPPRNAPIVVWQEGGPGPAMLSYWFANVENPYALLPGMGTALLVTPLAGRPGYTTATFNALADNANFGQVDIDEQAEIVRQMQSRGWTSAGKVGITGCSYGGYFTLQSIQRHPDLYRAANAQCGLVDLVTEWTRGYDRLMQFYQGLPPFNHLEEYRRDSPAYNAARIRTPLLTFHGTGDFLPITQNENLHLQLLNRGVNARMVKFIDEGHGLGNPANQLYAAQEQVSWFRTHLGR
jgi:dipeptidyl aminopeptidase/acylaminoacyl peptidase